MKFIFLFLCSFAVAQQTKFVDFKSVSGKVILNAKEKSVSGQANYFLEVLQPTDSIAIDAQNMSFSVVKMNGKEVPFINTGKQIQFIGTLVT